MSPENKQDKSRKASKDVNVTYAFARGKWRAKVQNHPEHTFEASTLGHTRQSARRILKRLGFRLHERVDFTPKLNKNLATIEREIPALERHIANLRLLIVDTAKELQGMGVSVRDTAKMIGLGHSRVDDMIRDSGRARKKKVKLGSLKRLPGDLSRVARRR